MANLGTFILTNKNYEDLSELTGITFSDNTTYQMQNLGEDFYIRVGNIGEGYRIAPNEKFGYLQKDNENVYIKPVFPDSIYEKKINISV